MANTVLSLSVADECLICNQCHHPIDVQRCSPILASSPASKGAPPSQYLPYTSTPCSPISRSTPNYCFPREGFRNAELSHAVKSISGVDTDDFGLHETSLLLERTEQSFAGRARSCFGEGIEYDLSPRSQEQLSMALCDSCSMSSARRRTLNLLSDRTTPGSRMSMYFPDRTGFDMADNLTNDVSDAISQSMNSEDSGACDVDVRLPSSDDCSSNEQESGPKLEGQRLQTPNRYNDNKQTGPKYEGCNELNRVHTFNNNNSNINENNNNEAESKRESCIKNSSRKLEPSNKVHASNNNSSYDIILTPQEAFTRTSSTNLVQTIARELKLKPSPQDKQSRSVLDDPLAQVNEEEDKTADERFVDIRRHLENARKYYHELTEQWFWKNVIILEKEEEQLKKRAEVMRAATATVTKYAKNPDDARTQKSSKSESLKKVNTCLEELSGRLTDVVFIMGHCERLTTEHLGGVIIKRCLQSEVLPRCLLPGKCLWSFDSRGGRTSDYMATGVSLTSSGDVIVTDTGLDMVTVFSKTGVKKLDINTAPGDYPTNAAEFGDTIAVACGSEVKLYDKVDGIYHKSQLVRSLSRPQGVTTDKHGHLVVSGYCIDIPTVAVYDRNTHLLNMMIHGDKRCDLAFEDTIGSELDEPPNQVLFSKPWYVATDQSDGFLISDRDSHMICIINRQGELVEQLGSLGHKPGQFFHPAGVCLDQQGCVIVADSQNNRIQVVTPDRQTALCILDKEHDNIECPTDVAIDQNGLLYVLQGSGLVSVYQYC